ncbi:MAG: putative hemolysin [Chlamydiales bacterium]|jgi:putative hemolysin
MTHVTNHRPTGTLRATSAPGPLESPSVRSAEHELARSRPLGGEQWIPELKPDSGRYRLRFARTYGDLEDACRLRYEVFNLELGEGLPGSDETGLDQDEFDEQCQHLLVIDSQTEQVVGTYRMQVAEAARAGNGFYSETEYDISTFPAEDLANAVELGRACVAKEHRSKSVLFMLWRGMLSYVRANNRQLFFGCSSLTSQDPALGRRAYRQLLREGKVHPKIALRPKPEFRCDVDPHAEIASDATADSTPIVFPTLFALYLRFGAKVIGAPAIDRTFGTIDFLIIVDSAKLSTTTLASIA